MREGYMEEKPKKKIRFNRVYCQSCDKPSEFRYEGALSALYLKCWSCGEAIQAYTANLGKDAVWKEQAEYDAEQSRKTKETKV